jgi:hypothetical protein
MSFTCDLQGARGNVNVSYVSPQAHGIINVALHWKYPTGIVFISSQGKHKLYHV